MLVLEGQPALVVALVVVVVEIGIDFGDGCLVHKEVFRPVATIAHISRRELGFK
jgi:hypothetical protein